MIGKQKSQLSLLDSAFNTIKKLCRTDDLLRKIDEFVNWDNLETTCKRMYKDSRCGRPSLRKGTLIDATLVQVARNKVKQDSKPAGLPSRTMMQPGQRKE